jgi:hypothetical protein
MRQVDVAEEISRGRGKKRIGHVRYIGTPFSTHPMLFKISKWNNSNHTLEYHKNKVLVNLEQNLLSITTSFSDLSRCDCNRFLEVFLTALRVSKMEFGVPGDLFFFFSPRSLSCHIILSIFLPWSLDLKSHLLVIRSSLNSRLTFAHVNYFE